MTKPASAAETAVAEGVTYFTIAGADLRMFRCEEHEATLSTRGCASRWTDAQGGAALIQYASAAAENRRTVVEEIYANEHGFDQANARRKLLLAKERQAATHALAKGLDACRTCPIGATHSGAVQARVTPHYQSDRCPRCGFGTSRMIGNRVCVGCYNREREVLKGINARGNAPERLPPVIQLPVRLVINGETVRSFCTVAAEHVAKVKTGKRDRRGRPEYATVPRGFTGEAVLQTLRTTKARPDFVVSVREPPLQRELALWAA